MNGKLITLACVMIASLAFGQSQTTNNVKSRNTAGTSSSTTQKTAPDTERPATSNDTVAVDSFTPGTSIVVLSTPVSHPTTYMLSKDVQYVDESGKKVDPSNIRAGTRVRLEAGGEDRHVGRIVVLRGS